MFKLLSPAELKAFQIEHYEKRLKEATTKEAIQFAFNQLVKIENLHK